jgi:hypothetical protein
VNHKFFLLFLLYVNLISLHALALIVRRQFFICASAWVHSDVDDDDDRQTTHHMSISAGRSRHHLSSRRSHPHHHYRNLFGAEQEMPAAMPVEDFPGRCENSASRLMIVTMLFVEAILFGLFTSCMICDQSSVVTTNLTKIDRLKLKAEETDSRNGAHEKKEGSGDGDGDDRSATVVVNEIFGGEGGRGFRIHWLLPILPSLPNSVRDEVFGFKCSPCAITSESTMNGSSGVGVGGGVGGGIGGNAFGEAAAGARDQQHVASLV